MPLEQAEIPLQRTNDGEKLPDPTQNQSSANSSFDTCVPTGLIFGPFLTFWFPKMLQAYLASSLPSQNQPRLQGVLIPHIGDQDHSTEGSEFWDSATRAYILRLHS